MIKRSYYRSRKARLCFLGFSFGVVLLLASFVDVRYRNSILGKKQLRITRHANIPLREISGLAINRPDPGSEVRKLYAVGDRYARVASLDVNSASHELGPVHMVDLTSTILDRLSVCDSREILLCKRQAQILTSQWEAINVDRSGKIFLLHEQLASVFVFSPEGDQLTNLLNLSSFKPEGRRTRLRLPSHKKNALGEGMLLLPRQRILVIKERQRASVIEFGLSGEQALGYQRDQIKGQTTAQMDFELPVKGKLALSPLHSWLLPTELSGCDLSELTQDESGAPYLLSQKCRWIMRFKDLSPESREIEVDQMWLLPSELKYAEALVVLGHGEFIVAEDKKSSKRPNLFFLAE